ncbi:MAG: alpha/beta fold hydrolase [Anaerolineae bacterium]|nr:alpha/beta fold hydrolase [Anaerolineae bacterium]
MQSPALRRGRYLRNLTIMLALAAGSLFALTRVCAIPVHWLWGLPLFYLTYLAWNAFTFAHPRRLRYWPRRESLFANAENVQFTSRDGLQLYAWYLPGSNGAAIVLAHTLGGSGLLMQGHAEFLRDAGYSILLLDLRAHGRSQGHTSTSGILEAQDVAAAVDYLRARGDLDADKIGVLGVSLGAQAAWRGALQHQAIRALVLEGLGPADIQDRIRPLPGTGHGRTLHQLRHKLLYPLALFDQWLFNFFIGQHPTPVIADIGHIAPRPILFIACGPREIEMNRRFCAASESGILWELLHARHAAGLFHEPEEYPRRVTAFFDEVL